MSENSSSETQQEIRPLAKSSRVASRHAVEVSRLTSICAGGLALTFFFPWMNLVLIRPSGLNFAQDGGMAALLWSLPFFAIFTIIAGLAKQGQKPVGAIAGLIPLGILAVALSKEGANLFASLEPAAWVGILLGVLLLVLAPQMK